MNFNHKFEVFKASFYQFSMPKLTILFFSTMGQNNILNTGPESDFYTL